MDRSAASRFGYRLDFALILVLLLAASGIAARIVAEDQPFAEPTVRATTPPPVKVPTPLIGLLTRNEANFHTGIGRWVPGLNCTVALSRTQHRDGRGSLAFTTFSRGTAFVRLGPFRIVPGQRYSASAWVRDGGSPRRVQLSMYWLRHDVRFVSRTSSSMTRERPQRWARVTSSGRAPLRATSASLVVRVGDAAENETHYIDSVRFDDTNLLTVNQANVEAGSSGFGAKLGSESITPTSVESWEGDSSLRVATPGISNEEGVTWDPAQSEPGRKYVGSLWVKGDGRLRVYLQDAGPPFEAAIAYVRATPSWKRVVTPPLRSNTTAIWLVVDTQRRERATFYLDGAAIERARAKTRA